MPKLEHKKVQCILTTLQVEDESEETIDAEDLINIKQAVPSSYVLDTFQRQPISSLNIFTSFMALIEGMCNSRPNQVDYGQQI